MSRKKKLNKSNKLIKTGVRSKVKPYDYEKGAIVYLAMFRKYGNVKSIPYNKYSFKWMEWFPTDSYGCGDIIKRVHKETVEKAGTTEESIMDYLASVRICERKPVPKELQILAESKGMKITRTTQTERYLSGYRVVKNCGKKHHVSKSTIVLGRCYECTLESVEKFLNNLPNIEDVKDYENKVIQILDGNYTTSEKIQILKEYPYYTCSFRFNVYMSKFIKRCDVQDVLNRALRLCDKLKINDLSNERPLTVDSNRNAFKSLEQMPYFTHEANIRKKVNKSIAEAGIGTEYEKWTKEDILSLRESMQKLYPKEYDYLRDRKRTHDDFQIWIGHIIANKGYKVIEKEIKEYREYQNMPCFREAFESLGITEGITDKDYTPIYEYMEQHYPVIYKEFLSPTKGRTVRRDAIRHMWNLSQRNK